MTSPPKPWQQQPSPAGNQATSMTTESPEVGELAPALPPSRPVADSFHFDSPAYGGFQSTGYQPSTSFYPRSSYPSSSYYASPYSASSPYNSYGGSSFYGASSPYSPYGNMGGYPYNHPQGGLPSDPSYQATFQLLSQFVQMFGGMAHLLESTFMATQSSCVAMVGLAQHMGALRQFMGDLMGHMVAPLQGLPGTWLAMSGGLGSLLWSWRSRKSPSTGDAAGALVHEFQKQGSASPSPSMKRQPIWLFVLLVVGLPWLMQRLVRRLREKEQQQQEQKKELEQKDQKVTVEFAKALYDFQGQPPHELSFKKGDLIGILSRTDPQTGQPAHWWRGKLQHSPVGFFPGNYVQLLDKKVELSSGQGTRALNAPGVPTAAVSPPAIKKNSEFQDSGVFSDNCPGNGDEDSTSTSIFS